MISLPRLPRYPLRRFEPTGFRPGATIRAARRPLLYAYSEFEVGDSAGLSLRAARLGQMRCHFLKDGHVQQVMALPGLSAEEAIEQSKQLFESVSHLFDDFEVWNEGFLIYPEDQAFRSDT